ncbi:MAG: PKD domain-containing protein [Candidatus Cloacimonetes bacterium]|nr:PKD domain-containing protein [Candidatus Cloacimonadota bacterium]
MKTLHFLLAFCFLFTLIHAQAFIEDWSSGTFGNWTFQPYQPANWEVTGEDGNPSPCAVFRYNPNQLNYDFYMISPMISVIGMTNPSVQFDMKLFTNSTATIESIRIEARCDTLGSAWQEFGQWDNQAGEFEQWTSYLLDLQPANGGDSLQFRFHMSGVDSANFDFWHFDNIELNDMLSACSVSGTVTEDVSPYGPIPNAEVYFNDWRAVSDVNGDYSLLVPVGDYNGSSYADGYYENHQYSGIPLPAGSYTVDFEMTLLPVLSGVVTDLLNDAPIDNAEISCFSSSNSSLGTQFTHSDPDGTYSISLPSASDWEISCEKYMEYQMQTVNSVNISGDTALDFALVPEGAADWSDLPENAQQIPLPLPYSAEHILYPQGEEDWFYVSLVEGETVDVWTERYNGGDIDPFMGISGPSTAGPPFGDIDPYSFIYTDDNSGGDMQPFIQFTVQTGEAGDYLIHIFDGHTRNPRIGYYRLHVEPGDPLVADFVAAGDTIGLAPYEISFTDLSSGDITDWAWDFGDGETSTDQHPTHEYPEPGLYSVQLIVYDGPQADTLTRVDYIDVRVYIPDDNFRIAINEELGYLPPESATHDPSVAEMASIVNLYAGSLTIDELSGAEYLVNCDVLELQGNQISDLAPLANLSGLSELRLDDNLIVDISPLSGFSEISIVNLSGNTIADPSLINNFEDVEVLRLNDCGLADIAFASSLDHLEILEIEDNNVSDLQPISGHIWFDKLYAANNIISDLTPLSGVPYMGFLYLQSNHVSDLAPLSALNDLSHLDLSDNQIEDISALEGITNINHLALDGNDIDRIEALIGLGDLNYLSFCDNNVSDIWPLTQNAGLGDYDTLRFTDNPVSKEAYEVHIPELAIIMWDVFAVPDTYDQYAPCYPQPERDATDVPQSVTFEWRGDGSRQWWYYITVWDDGGTEVVDHEWVVPTGGDTLYSYVADLDPEASYTWSVEATDFEDSLYGGIWAFSTAELELNADFTATNTSGTAPLTVQFYDDSSASGTTITEWMWDFDNDGSIDSTYATSVDPTYTYYDEGVYDVALTVSDGVESDTFVSAGLVTVNGSVFPPGSEITGTYTDAGGPYTVEGQAYVPVGDTLIINGAQFTFLPGARLDVEGTLITTSGQFVAEAFDVWGGIYYTPTATGCDMQSFTISGAVPALEIEDCSPVFDAVNLEITDDFTRPPYGWGVFAHTGAVPQFDNMQMDGYEYGIHLQNIGESVVEEPIFNNISITNTETCVQTDDTGILMQNAVAHFHTLLIEGYTYGISVDTFVGGTRSTPTLTNIRVRNSGSATRTDDVGIYLKDVENIVITGDSILFYTTGIAVETTEGFRNTSTPTITNIRVRNSGSATRTDDVGIKLHGRVNADISDIEVGGYSAGIEIVADSLATESMLPELTNVSISADTTFTREDGIGLVMLGAVSCDIDSLLVEGYPAGIIIEDTGSGLTRSTPTLTNIRVRNSGSATRVDSIGIAVVGTVNLALEDAWVDSFATGILLSNYAMRDLSTPTLTNIRVRNSGSATRTDTYGIRFEGGVAVTADGIEIDDYMYGIHYSDFAGGARTTPTLTNIRVRNSGSATREAAIGVLLIDVSEIHVAGDSVAGYPVGIQIETTGRTLSTPTLTNIRVRNSGSATRPDNTGVQILGSVDATLESLEIIDFDYGLHYTGDGVARRTTPTLTNIRVRNSGSATRQPMAGIVLVDVPNVSLDADTVLSYPLGYQLINNTGAPWPVALQNVFASNPYDAVRLDGTGIDLGDGLQPTIIDSHVEGFATGAALGNGVASVLGNTFLNCDSGLDVLGSAQVDINGNVFYLDAQYPPNRVQGPAIVLHHVPDGNLGSNTVHNYDTGVRADTSNVEMRQTIIWHNPPLVNPIELNGSTMDAFYNDISYIQANWGDESNLNEDPSFEDSGQGDFNLTVYSPCIDAGDPNGTWDPEGNEPDIGAFRYPHMADFEVNPRFATIGDPVQFTNLSIGHPAAISAYEWDFDNDGIMDSFEAEPQYMFDTAGTYDVFMRVTSAAVVDTVYYYHYCVYQEHQLQPPQNFLVQRQGDDIHLSWDPVTHTVPGVPVIVDYYIIFAATDANDVFQFLDFTPDAIPAYVHTGIIAQEDKYFYFLLAYSGSRDDLDGFLTDHAGLRFEVDGVRWFKQSEMKQDARQ